MYSLAVTNGTLSDEQVSRLVHEALADPKLDGQRILVLIPDRTRTAPIPQMFRLLHKELSSRAAALDFLIALGTHNPLSQEQIDRLVGVKPEERETIFKGVRIFNHLWNAPDTLISCFLKQWDKFQAYPAGVLAHSTHLKGMGTFDPVEGEQARIRVTLATGISPERCAAHNLNYRDPATIRPAEWANREDEGILLVPKAGEILYRVKK